MSSKSTDAGASAQSGRTRIIAVANQKGGVGKSTTAVSLGAALAERGRRVLVIDLDPQGNASTGLGIRHEAREVTVYDVLSADGPIRDAIIETPLENLFAIPSTIDLAGAEIELVSQFSREMRLRRALDPLRDGGGRLGFDFVLLDCPPSLGLLTINALAAAEELIVPIQCEYYALEGLGQLLRNVRLVQQNVNPELRLTGIVMTMFDPRTKLSEQVVEEVRKYFGDLVYRTIIPRTVRLSEAPGFGLPITVYDPRSRGAECYRDLAREVVGRSPIDAPLPAFDDLPTIVVEPIQPTAPGVEAGVAPGAPTGIPARAPRPLRREEEGETEPEIDEMEARAETYLRSPAVSAEPEDDLVSRVPEPQSSADVEGIEREPVVEPEPVAPVAPVGVHTDDVRPGAPSSMDMEPEREEQDAIMVGGWGKADAGGTAVPERDEKSDDEDDGRRWSLFRRGGRR